MQNVLNVLFKKEKKKKKKNTQEELKVFASFQELHQGNEQIKYFINKNVKNCSKLHCYSRFTQWHTIQNIKSSTTKRNWDSNKMLECYNVSNHWFRPRNVKISRLTYFEKKSAKKNKSSVKLTIGSVIGSVNRFDCYRSEKNTNSFLAFLLTFLCLLRISCKFINLFCVIQKLTTLWSLTECIFNPLSASVALI